MTEQKKTNKNLFVFANRPAPAAGGPLPGKAASYAGDVLRQLGKDAAAVAAVVILAILILMAVFAPDFNGYRIMSTCRRASKDSHGSLSSTVMRS